MFGDGSKIINKGSANWRIDLEIKFSLLERFQLSSRCKMEMLKEFGTDLATPLFDVNLLMEACNEIRTQVYLHFTSVASRLGREEFQEAAMERSI